MLYGASVPQFQDPYSSTVVFDDSEVPVITGDPAPSQKSMLPAVALLLVGSFIAYKLFVA